MSATKKHNKSRAEGQTAIGVSMTIELRARIKSAAKNDRRTVSNWIALRCEEYLDGIKIPEGFTLGMEPPPEKSAPQTKASTPQNVIDPAAGGASTVRVKSLKKASGRK